MAGLDMKKLREQSKTIANRAGGGDGILFYSKSLKEEGSDFRIAEPTEGMGGQYYVDQVGYWIKGKFYQSNETFGGDDVIGAEIQAAVESGDEELIALAEAVSNKMKVVKKETRPLIPGYFLDVKMTADESAIESIKVIDDAGKILVCKNTLMNDIHAIVTNKLYQNNTVMGIADRKKGWNLILVKKGSGIDTEYSAIGWNQQTEMEDKYYEGDRFPDVLKYIKDMKRSDAHLRSVIRNYFYGEDIITDAKPVAGAKPAAGTDTKPAASSTPAANPRTGGAAAGASPRPKPEGAKPNPRGTAGGTKTGAETKKDTKKGRSLLDDAEAEVKKGANADGMGELD